MQVLTNNPLAQKTLEQRELCGVSYIEGGYRDVLTAVRDMVHRCYMLETHPLSGSVKPNETPYKSIGVSDKPARTVDFESLQLIENALSVFDKFPKRYDSLPEGMDRDFQVVDTTLILSAF